MAFDWTPETIEILKGHAKEGLSASAIAGRMGGGLTRSAVIGKCHREGIKLGRVLTDDEKRARASQHGKLAARPPRKDQPVVYPRRAVSLAPTSSVSDASSAPKHVRQPKLPRIEAILPDPWSSAIPPEGVTLLELRADSCRFPVGPKYAVAQFFCGEARKDASPYCAHHHGVCFTPAPKKKPAGETQPFVVKKRSAWDLRAEA